MNKRVLALAVATALVSPMTASADVKLSGAIQAEVISAKFADGERETITTDNAGSVANGGPNNLTFSIDEKMDTGLTAYGKISRAFSTFKGGASLAPLQHYVGLKGSGAYLQFGRISGLYKYGNTLDPLYETSVQARGAGGATGSGFGGHSGYLDNVVQAGFEANGFGVAGQYIADESSANDGSMQFLASYDNKTFSVYGAYAMQDDQTDNEPRNIAVGGKYSIAGLNLSLKYENAEIGTLDGGKGDYLFASASYALGNVIPTMWIAKYAADADNEDALSFSAAIIYAFSNRTIAYAAYHKTDSDNNTRDWDAFGVGMRHKF